MSNPPTLVFVPGAWHRASCYDKIIKILEEQHKLKCIAITLPSTTANPDATFKDDIDAAREAISSETTRGRNVVVLAHSYGGLVGSSAIKGFTQPKDAVTSSSVAASSKGYVIGFILIASGFSLTGLAFMDPFLGRPPPTWRINKETGFADLVVDPRQFFYHDLPDEEAQYHVSQLTPQSLKSLFEGGEHAYAGWMDVPAAWYIGTIEDQGLPVVAQRMNVGMAREMGCKVGHRELQTSHSPFLSQPNETVEIIVEAVEDFTGKPVEKKTTTSGLRNVITVPEARRWQPLTWYRFGLPLFFGHIIGRCVLGFGWSRRLWRSWFH